MEMNEQLAMVFPGQGSQAVGMLAQLAAENSSVKNIFAQASDVLGYDLWQLVQQGPKEKLNQTEYTQPALLAADIAIWECWCDAGGKLPTVVAGHSLGEYAALVCAQSINFQDAIRLVADRGRFMQQAVPEGIGAMAAIIGLSQEDVARICLQAAQGAIVSPANLNSPEQTVIAGHTDAVNRAVQLAKEKNAKIATIIPVSVPSHCVLMQPAADKLKQSIEEIVIKTPTIKVLHNIDAQSHQDPEKIRQALILQLTQPVRWVDIISKMHQLGINFFLECGPGKVLSSLNKRICNEAQSDSIGMPEKMAENIIRT